MTELLALGARRHLVFLLVSIIYLHVCHSVNPLNPVCDTPNCKKLGEYYKKSMNEQGKPCTDFYDYVCRNWGSHNPRPKYKTLWNAEQTLGIQTAHRLRELLENDRINNETIFRNVKALYRACRSLPYMEKADAKTIKAVIAGIGNWPMFPTTVTKDAQNIPWWQIESQYISKAGESSFLEFHVVADVQRTHKLSSLFFPPFSPFGMLKLFKPFHPELRRHYKAFLIDVIINVAPIPHATRALANLIDKDLDEVIKFREQMAEFRKNKFSLNETLKLTIGEFQEQYDKHVAGQETAKVNWLKMIGSFYKDFKDPSGNVVQSTTKISAPVYYYLKLPEILGKTPKRVIENHIHLYFAERHLKLDKQMEANLEKSVYGDTRPTGQIRYEPDRWHYCIDSNNLVIGLSKLYIFSNYPIQHRYEIQQLLKEETDLLKIRISQSSWLDPDTKNKSMTKLDYLENQIGFPDWFMDGRLLPDTIDYEVYPTEPNIFFAAKRNRIGASASFLQFPYFLPNMPYVVKYGCVGTALAHELCHGFDHIGLQFDASGRYGMWWPENMYNQFLLRANCVEEQFEKYKRAELRKRGITTRSEFNTLTEDIADVMGIKIAYMRYKYELEWRNGTCPILPGFEKLGCDKLFFIAFANLHCGDSTPAAERANLLGDVHSLAPIRVNAAVGNMEEFHKIFGCKAGDPIVPQRTCDIWK